MNQESANVDVVEVLCGVLPGIGVMFKHCFAEVIYRLY